MESSWAPLCVHEGGMSPVKHISVLSALCLTIALIYSDALGGSFHYDDFANVVNNPAIRSLDFATDISGSRYVTDYLSFALNYRLFGPDPLSYHAINIGIHALNACLVYWLVLLLCRAAVLKTPNRDFDQNSWFVAIAAAGIFAVHPIQTEAVD